jgi:ABC-type Fe3+ transport system permease subunit
MANLRRIWSTAVWLFESFILQAILLAIALSITYPHGQQVWYNQSKYGLWEAISMEITIAWLPLIIALAVFILAGYSQYRQGKRRDNRDQQMIDVLNKIAKKLGVDKE